MCLCTQRMNRRTTTYYVLVGLLLALLLTATYLVAVNETTLQRALQAHHADPPRARTALRSYERVIEASDDPRRTRAMYQAATIYDHGVLQGREPVLPDRHRAIGFYRQIAVVGAPLERALARERLVDLGDRVLETPRPRPTLVERPVERPVLLACNAADVIALRDARQLAGTPRSDSQNVLDSSIVKSVKIALDRLGPSAIPLGVSGRDCVAGGVCDRNGRG